MKVLKGIEKMKYMALLAAQRWLDKRPVSQEDLFYIDMVK